MSTPPAAILLVIPCYRHGDVLADYLHELCPALASAALNIRLLVVDDGSAAPEQIKLAAAIEQLRPAHPFLQSLLATPTNHGKGHAIRTGWATARTEPWLAFVDADGAVPAHEVTALLQRTTHATTPTVFVAQRTPHPQKKVQRDWHRNVGSRIFNTWVRWQLPLTLPDTQCGLKVIPRLLHDFGPWREAGFALDLEILLRAHAMKLPVQTHPIAWQEKPGTSLGWRNTLRLFADTRRLRTLGGRA